VDKKKMLMVMEMCLVFFLFVSLSRDASAQIPGQDSVTVTWYVSYDGFYDYVQQGPMLSDSGKVILVLAIISTFVAYQLWRRRRGRLIS